MANKYFCTVCLLFTSLQVCYASDYCVEKNLGWHFYCDPKKIKDEESIDVSPDQLQNAKAELKQVQERLDALKAQAVMNPTEINVRNYIAYQKEQLDRASKFSEVWSKVLWSNPHLDYMVTTPLNTIGNELRYEVKNKAIKEKLTNLHQRYGLFFFYSSNCIYCQKFSSILRTFAELNSLSVIAISMDGDILPDWQDSLINHGEADKFGMSEKPVPAVMLFDNEHKQVIPVGFGLLSMSELEERIYQLTQSEASNG